VSQMRKTFKERGAGQLKMQAPTPLAALPDLCPALTLPGHSSLPRMTVPLAVAGAFHTEYMQPAVAKLQEALANTTISTPRIPVISNVDAKPHSDPAVIKEILAKQVGGGGGGEGER
jgi:malonyl CoA-acyl carrier protein transacylase